MPERIIIEFPEDSNNSEKNDRLEIDINNDITDEISVGRVEPKVNHEGVKQENNKKNILDSKVNSFYKGSTNGTHGAFNATYQ